MSIPEGVAGVVGPAAAGAVVLQLVAPAGFPEKQAGIVAAHKSALFLETDHRKLQGLVCFLCVFHVFILFIRLIDGEVEVVHILVVGRHHIGIAADVVVGGVADFFGVGEACTGVGGSDGAGSLVAGVGGASAANVGRSHSIAVTYQCTHVEGQKFREELMTRVEVMSTLQFVGWSFAMMRGEIARKRQISAAPQAIKSAGWLLFQ